MSKWTHIVACIYLETSIEDKNIESIVREVLLKAPKITGSECDADIFVNTRSEHNTYDSQDCWHCPFNYTKVQHKNGCYSCNAPIDYECRDGEYQTSVIITIAGDLRDREIIQTKNEYKNFIKWLKDNFFLSSVRVKTCKITD